MVKIFQDTENEYYMDGILLENLKTAKEVVKADWDMVFCVDGYEGTGKSVIAQQVAYFCDPTLNLDRIVFTPEEFKDAIIKADKYQAIVYDEGYTGLSSRATMSKINRTLVAMIAEIRQKNLFVFVVMPTFFDLDKYVAIWRSRALIHVYTEGRFQRGFFKFYNVQNKKNLYVHGKKFYDYNKTKPNFIGRFTNHYTVDEAGYKEKKHKSLSNREQKVQDAYIDKVVQDRLFERLCLLGNKISHAMKSQILDMPESTYYNKLRIWREDNDIEANP